MVAAAHNSENARKHAWKMLLFRMYWFLRYKSEVCNRNLEEKPTGLKMA